MKTYATSLVKDGGKYNKTFVRFQKKVEYGEEKIFIKYGSFDFLPVTIISNNSNVLLSASCVGQLGDIIVSCAEWKRILMVLKVNKSFQNIN